MAIDHIIIGVRKTDEVKLTLQVRNEPLRDEITMVIENPPQDWQDLVCLIDAEVWGPASVLMLGDKKLADRLGYCGLQLVDNWLDVVTEYERAKR